MSPSPQPSRASSTLLYLVMAYPVATLLWSALAWGFLRSHLAALPVLALPMAPLTTLAMVLLASALLQTGRLPEARSTRVLAWSAFILTASLAVLVLGAQWAGKPLPLERWFIETPIPVWDPIRQELKQLGRMAPVTAILFLSLAPVPPLLRRHGQAAAVLAMAVLAASCILLLGFVIGTPLIHWEGLSPAAFLSDTCFATLGLGALMIAGPETHPMKLFWVGGAGPQSTRRFLLGFLAMSVLAFGGTIVFLRAQRQVVLRNARMRVAVIADLKNQQIATWFRERLGDAETLASSLVAEKAMASRAGGDPDLARWIESYRTQYSYRSVAFLDPRGQTRLASPMEPLPPPPSNLAAILAGREPVLQDLRRAPDGRFFMALWTPIRGPKGGPALGLLRLEIDPRSYLYPLLLSQPSSSRTAETLLARREGDHVLNLSPLRHRSDSALEEPRSLSQYPQLPAVQAAAGRTGEVEARDYRNISVLAALRRVPGTPWHLISKMDQAEFLVPLRTWAWVAATLAFTVLALATLGMALQLRDLQLRSLGRSLEIERQAAAMAERYYLLMREANDLVLLADQNLFVIEANPRAEERYGTPPGGLAGMDIRELSRPGSEEDLAKGLAALEAHGSVIFETSHRDGRGGGFPVSLSMNRVEIDGIAYVLVFGQDITERRAHEHEVRRLTRLYAALSQVNQTLVRAQNREQLFRECCQVLGLYGGFQHTWISWFEPETQMVSLAASYGSPLSIFSRFPFRLDEGEEGKGPTGQAIRTGGCVYSNDLSGDPAFRETSHLFRGLGFASMGAFPIRFAGKICGTLVVASEEKDIFHTQEVALLEEAASDLSFAMDHLEEVAGRIRAQEETRLQMERMHLAAASAQLGIWEIDLGSGLLIFDGRTAEIYGLPAAATVPKEAWRQWLHQEDQARAQASVEKALEAGGSFSITFRILRADAQVRTIRTDGLVLKDGEGVTLRCVGLCRDLTEDLRQEEERHNLQVQLHQAQKMESLGLLAGGVAHDMNNVLGAILSRASAEREAMDPGAPLARSLEVIIDACLRGRGVVKSLLCFARQELEENRPVDLNDLVREVVQLLAHTTLSRVTFATDLEEPLPRVLGDSGALNHALMNLCVNSMDAMPKGGAITLRTRTLSDGWVQLSVQDTGQGMSPEVQEKALEPFFTTKPAGKGTGLGLAMVFGTVKAHGGTMAIESKLGAGTTIHLRIPPTAVQEPEPSRPAPPPPLPKDKSLRVLFVDDDELIRSAVVPMLEMMGHSVKEAPGGQEALQMLEGGLQVDLVILDMNMPGLNGAETLPRLLALRPGQRVLMSSGYSDQDIRSLMERHPTVASVQKPFTVQELRAKLAEC